MYTSSHSQYTSELLEQLTPTPGPGRVVSFCWKCHQILYGAANSSDMAADIEGEGYLDCLVRSLRGNRPAPDIVRLLLELAGLMI